MRDVGGGEGRLIVSALGQSVLDDRQGKVFATLSYVLSVLA